MTALRLRGGRSRSDEGGGSGGKGGSQNNDGDDGLVGDALLTVRSTTVCEDIFRRFRVGLSDCKNKKGDNMVRKLTVGTFFFKIEINVWVSNRSFL